MTNNQALNEIRELGHMFAVQLAERGKRSDQSDLMNGLAAYHLLDLAGVSARLDQAHAIVLKMVTDGAFALAKKMAA
jgi:hypothetical protein